MKNFAVFLDRDGVINADVGNLHKFEDLRIIPKVPLALKLLNDHRIPVIVITNQAVVARGWFSERDVLKLHQRIAEQLGTMHAKIDAFYFCPHHPNADLKKYRVVCQCRKPKIKLFKEAAKKFSLDLKSSYVVGDCFRDIEAGQKIGATTIGVKTGSSDFRQSTPDYMVEDLLDATKLILQKENLL